MITFGLRESELNVYDFNAFSLFILNTTSAYKSDYNSKLSIRRATLSIKNILKTAGSFYAK